MGSRALRPGQLVLSSTVSGSGRLGRAAGSNTGGCARGNRSRLHRPPYHKCAATTILDAAPRSMLRPLLTQSHLDVCLLSEITIRNIRGVYLHRFCKLNLIPPAIRPQESPCGGLTDRLTARLLSACCNLHELSMPGMPHLTRASVVAALTGCPSLRRLSLRGTMPSLKLGPALAQPASVLASTLCTIALHAHRLRANLRRLARGCRHAGATHCDGASRSLPHASGRRRPHRDPGAAPWAQIP